VNNTDLYLGLKQHITFPADNTGYEPDSEYDISWEDDTWDPENNTLTGGQGIDFTTIFQVGDLVFNEDWYAPHAFVTEVTSEVVTFDGPLGGLNENGFCLGTYDGLPGPDPTPLDVRLFAYRAGNHEAAYLFSFASSTSEPCRFTAKGGAPDYVKYWWNNDTALLPIPDPRVVEVIDDATVRLDIPFHIENGNDVLIGQDGVVQRAPLKDKRYFQFYYGLSYWTMDIYVKSLRNVGAAWWEPWDAYVISPYNANLDQAKKRIDKWCGRIDGLISGNYADNWVEFDEDVFWNG